MQYGRDWLIETMPEVIDLVAKGEAKGEAKGKIEGALLELRQMFAEVIQTRFPTLLTLAQQQVEEMTDPAALRKLVLDIMSAPDKETARHLLLSYHTA